MKILDHSQLPRSLADTSSVVNMVLRTIERRLPAHVSREDLASVGKVALIEALLKFAGPAEEAGAYCYVCVRGAVFDELRRQDPLSRHTRAQVSLVQRASTVLEHKLGRAPTCEEMAAFTGLSTDAIAQLERLATAAQTETPRDSDAAGVDPLQALVDADAPCPAASAESVDAHASVRAALDRLAPNQARVLRRYYLDDATLEDIAGELALSKERVRQIREAAEKKLREDFIVLALWQTFLTRGSK